MRAGAILAVVAYHLSPSIKGGGLGVDVFFVLSGFLITTLLIGERDRRGFVSFKAFYARRALRLLPAFYAVFVVAALLAATVAAHRERAPTLTNLPWSFFYGGNLRASYGHTDLGLLNATWSLAEEEQFYLLWPAICVWLLNRSVGRLKPALILGGLAAGEMVYRFLLVHHGADLSRIEYGPDTRSDGLLLGCALAFALRSRPFRDFTARIQPNVRAGIGMACAVTLAALMLRAPTTQVGVYRFEVPIAVVVSAGLLWSLVTAPMGPLHKLLTTAPAVWLGRRSYGLYLWHVPLILGIPLTGLSHAERLPLHLTMSLVATALCYRFIEQPFLRRKARWQTDLQPARSADAVPRDSARCRAR